MPLGISLGLSGGVAILIIVGTWILAANAWDDSGVWLDSASWND